MGVPGGGGVVRREKAENQTPVSLLSRQSGHWMRLEGVCESVCVFERNGGMGGG